MEDQQNQGKSGSQKAQDAAQAAKTGANIAKGAASGGWTGAAIEAAKDPIGTIKLICYLAVGQFFLILIPVLLIISLPLVIFDGLDGLFGSGIDDDLAFKLQNYRYIQEALNEGLESAHQQIIEEIYRHIAVARNHYVHFEYRIQGETPADIDFSAAIIIGLYSASKEEGDYENISIADFRRALLEATGNDLFSFDIESEYERRYYYHDPEWCWETELYIYLAPTPYYVITYVYTVVFNGEMAFAEVFGIADNPEALARAREYARNLMYALERMDNWREPGIVEGFYNPFPGTNWIISSCFGYRTHPISGRREFHTGIDIPKQAGTEMRAIASGRVTHSGTMGGFGITIVIDHGEGITSLYAHNRVNFVSVGDWVNGGDVIAEVGSTGVSTGPHLHLEVSVSGRRYNPTSFIGPPPGGCGSRRCTP